MDHDCPPTSWSTAILLPNSSRTLHSRPIRCNPSCCLARRACSWARKILQELDPEAIDFSANIEKIGQAKPLVHCSLPCWQIQNMMLPEVPFGTPNRWVSFEVWLLPVECHWICSRIHQPPGGELWFLGLLIVDWLPLHRRTQLQLMGGNVGYIWITFISK